MVLVFADGLMIISAVNYKYHRHKCKCKMFHNIIFFKGFHHGAKII